MSEQGETFFTSVGCMDGRAQEQILKFGRKKFRAKFADIITEAGLVGLLSKKSIDQTFLSSLKKKIFISLEKHHSKGIVVHGHQECAASDAVDDKIHKDDILKSVKIVKSLINSSVPVVGAFVKRSQSNPSIWKAEELHSTDLS